MVSVSLKGDLQEISGVGEATADKILDVVADHESGGVDPSDVEKALEFMDRNSYAPARSVLESALE